MARVKTWPLIRNHKRRINRNESAGQCDGFLWTVDILTGSIISSVPFLFSFFPLCLLLFFFFLHLKRNRSYCDEGVTPLERGIGEKGTPPAPFLPCPRPRTNLWTWDPRFMWNTGTQASLSLVLAPSPASLIRPLKKRNIYIYIYIILWAKLVYQRSTGVSPVNDL